MDEHSDKFGWNMADEDLKRISSYLYLAGMEFKTHRLENCWDTIWLIYRDVYPYMSGNERKDFKKIVDGGEHLLEELSKSHGDGIVIKRKLMAKLHSAYIFLKDCMGKHGLLAPKKGDPGRAVVGSGYD